MAKTLRIQPSPDLAPTAYIPGVSPDGTELPYDEAMAWVNAGLAVVASSPVKAEPESTESANEAPAE